MTYDLLEALFFPTTFFAFFVLLSEYKCAAENGTENYAAFTI
jgi:hypothetical protein